LAIAITSMYASIQRAKAEYPERPITVVVPFAPGGAGDLSARLVAEDMSKKLGQQIILLGKPGAGTQIGLEYVARAKPDGYTFGVASTGLLLLPFTSKSFTLDPIKAFEPVGLLSVSPSVATTNAGLGVNTLKEFIDYGKAHPGKLNFGAAGASDRVAAMWLNQLTGIDMEIIPYQGGGPIATALMSDQVNLSLLPTTTAKTASATGKVVPLAVTSPQRFALLPDVPTVDEAGLPGYYISFWFGLVAPAGTPPDIIAKVNGALLEAISKADVKQRLAQSGLETVSYTPAEVRAFWDKDVAFWTNLAKRADIKPE
jgi:tripartite-type tricarboxylate transporter receptor subunit TctC